MSNLQVGWELLFVGMVVVFSILFLLMGLMTVMSKLVSKFSVASTPSAVPLNESAMDEELAAITAVITPFVESMGQCNIKIREIK